MMLSSWLRLHVHRHVLQWNLDIIAAIVVTITASSKWLAVSAAANAHQMHLCPVQKAKANIRSHDSPQVTPRCTFSYNGYK